MFEAIRKKTGPRSFLEITAEKANAAMVAGDIGKALRCETILAKAESKRPSSAQQRQRNENRLKTRRAQETRDAARHEKEKDKRKKHMAALRTAAAKDPELANRLATMGITFEKADPFAKIENIGQRFAKAYKLTEAQSIVTAAELLPELAEQVLKAHQNEVDPWPTINVKKKAEIEATVDARIKKGVDPFESVSAEEFAEYQTEAMGFNPIG